MKRPNPYACRNLPIWHGVKEGGEEDQLNIPTAICIDPTSQQIYVGEDYTFGRILFLKTYVFIIQVIVATYIE